MEGSEWESIRKSYKKRIVISFLISIPVFILSGIFFYNNRDFFRSNTLEEAASNQASSLTDSLMIDTLVEDSIKDKSTVLDSDSHSSFVLEIQPEIKKVNDESTKPLLQSSVILPRIECWTFDRRDLKLVMSLELYFQGHKSDKDIAVMRNDLKVVIQRLVSGKELNSIKKEILKSEIIHSVNDMLGTDFFKDLKIVDFKIEKVI